MKRLITRGVLLLCGIAALLSIAAAFYFKGVGSIEAWIVLAAALAVLTSVISAWSAQITVEIQEDQLRPSIIVYIDDVERYWLLQLKLKNIGKGPAYRIVDHWDNELRDQHGNGIRFARDNSSVSILYADQSLSKIIDVPNEFFARYNGEVYRGYVVFEDAGGRSYKSEVIINPKEIAETIAYAHEAVRTHYELQQIPKKLDEIKDEITKISST